MIANPKKPQARDGTGRTIHPGDGVVPIMKELTGRKLAVEGTGFYVSRYGLFITARHVLDTLCR